MSELLSQAAQLMLVGMGAVIIFLFLLVVAMSVMKRLIPTPTVASTQPAHGDTDSEAVPSKVLAAISAAIHSYRQGNKAANNKEKS